MSPAGRAEEGDEENKQGKAAWPLIASPAIGRGPLLNKRLAHPLLTHCSMGIHRSACVTPYWEAIETIFIHFNEELRACEGEGVFLDTSNY